MNIDILKNELKFIEQELEKIEIKISENVGIGDYKLVAKKGNGYYQYWYRDSDNKLRYIPSKDREFAKHLAEKEYYLKLKKTLINQKRVIEIFVKQYNVSEVFDIGDSFCEAKKLLFDPLYLSGRDYTSEWLDEHPGNQNAIDFIASYLTNRGDEVRSKSEKILADLFYRYKIPYCYEPEFVTNTGKKYYPDFVLLNVKERKTYYWEHFGLTSSKEYADKNLDKLARYEKAGLILGENLIVSFESAGVSLDVKLVEEKIRRFLL